MDNPDLLLKLLEELADQPTGLDYLYTLLRYVAHGTDKLSRTELTSTVERIFRRGNHIMSTIAAEWLQEGRQEGRHEGMRFSPGSFFCITKTMPRIHYAKPSIPELEVAYATDVAYNGSGSSLYEYITNYSGISL